MVVCFISIYMEGWNKWRVKCREIGFDIVVIKIRKLVRYYFILKYNIGVFENSLFY